MKDEHRENIKEAFLKHVGKVIKKNRKDKIGWSQTALAMEVGSSDTAISRFENGDGDITAAMMAYIAVSLDFPLSEYVEYYDYSENGEQIKKTVDVLLRELFSVANKDFVMMKLGIAPTISGTILNEDTNQYEFSVEMSKAMNVRNPKQMQEEQRSNAPMVCECMMHDETGATSVIRYMYALTQKYKGKTPPESLQMFVSAALLYAMDLTDGQSQHYIVEYLKELL